MKSTSWSGGLRGTERLYQELKDDLGVFIVPDTSYVTVRFRASTQSDAEVIVQTVMEKYLGIKKQEAATDLSLKLTEGRRELQALADKLGIIRTQRENQRITWRLSDKAGPVAAMYAECGRQAARLEAEVLQSKARWEALKNGPSELSLEDTLLVRQDPQIAALEQLKLTLELGLDRNGLPESRPAPQPAETRIQIIEAKLAALRAQRAEELRSGRLKAAQQAYLDALSSHLSLNERMTELKDEYRDQDVKLAHEEMMRKEQQLLEARHEQLSSYVQNLQMMVDRSSITGVRQASPAVAEVDHTTAIGLTTVSVVVPLGYALLLLLLRISRRRKPANTCANSGGDGAMVPDTQDWVEENPSD